MVIREAKCIACTWGVGVCSLKKRKEAKRFHSKSQEHPTHSLYLNVVEELEAARGLGGLLDGPTQLHRPSTPFGPVGAAHRVKGTSILRQAADQVQFRLRVRPAVRVKRVKRSKPAWLFGTPLVLIG